MKLEHICCAKIGSASIMLNGRCAGWLLYALRSALTASAATLTFLALKPDNDLWEPDRKPASSSAATVNLTGQNAALIDTQMHGPPVADSVQNDLSGISNMRQ